MSEDAYRASGVDLEAARRAVSLISESAAGATRGEVVGGIGGFAGLFRAGGTRLLAASADGIGTKVEIARLAGRFDTVGIDLVAMCADDVVCCGAEPLFMLDYVAVERLVPEDVAAIVAGVAEGCRRAGCALLGGETAEHPGLMPSGGFDLAGFCVGSLDESELLGPDRVRPGDALVGLASSGLHANGYSLVRSALLPRFALDATPPGLDRTLGEELLEPTVIYAPLVLSLSRKGLVHAAAHVTGGGLEENLARVLPGGVAADIDREAWPEPPIFGLIRSTGVDDASMRRTFNLGVGMVLLVAPDDADAVVSAAREVGTEAWLIGTVG